MRPLESRKVENAGFGVENIGVLDIRYRLRYPPPAVSNKDRVVELYEEKWHRI